MKLVTCNKKNLNYHLIRPSIYISKIHSTIVLCILVQLCQFWYICCWFCGWCRFCCPYVHCWQIQIQMIHWFQKLLICARMIKSSMNQWLVVGLKSMPWTDSQEFVNEHGFIALKQYIIYSGELLLYENENSVTVGCI